MLLSAQKRQHLILLMPQIFLLQAMHRAENRPHCMIFKDVHSDSRHRLRTINQLVIWVLVMFPQQLREHARLALKVRRPMQKVILPTLRREDLVEIR